MKKIFDKYRNADAEGLLKFSFTKKAYTAKNKKYIIEQTGGGAHSRTGEGLGESQFRRLEKKLSTLPSLWGGGGVAGYPPAGRVTSEAKSKAPDWGEKSVDSGIGLRSTLA